MNKKVYVVLSVSDLEQMIDRIKKSNTYEGDYSCEVFKSELTGHETLDGYQQISSWVLLHQD